MKTKTGEPVELSGRIITVLVALLLAVGGCAFYLVRTTAIVEERQATEATIRARDNSELKEMLRDYQAQVVSGFVTTQAYIAANSNKVQFMTGLLTREQQERVRRFEEANPMPSLPNPEQFKFRAPAPKGSKTNENEQEYQSSVRSGL